MYGGTIGAVRNGEDDINELTIFQRCALMFDADIFHCGIHIPRGSASKLCQDFCQVSSGQHKGQRIMIITSQGLVKGLDPVFHRIEVGTSVAAFNSQKSESQENEMRAICQKCDISKVVCHRYANAMQGFLTSVLREL